MDRRRVQRQTGKESGIPDPENLKEGDSLPLEDPITPKGLENAPWNLVAFVKGLAEGTTLSWYELGTIMAKAHDPRSIVYLPSYFDGIVDGVYGAVKEYAELITNIDKFIQVVLNFVKFLVFRAEPSVIRDLGTEIAAQYSGRVKTLSNLEAGKFYRRLGEFVGPLLLELLLSYIGVGIVGKTSKIARKLGNIIPGSLRKKADSLVKTPDRKKPPEADRPEWQKEKDTITYRDEEGRKQSPVEQQKEGLNIGKLKRQVLDRWDRAIANDTDRRPVKVVARTRGPAHTTGGYITERRFIKGASPRRMEEILGLPEGELTSDGNGAIVQILDETPSPENLELKGSTLFPEGESMSAEQYPYLKGSGVPQWVIKTDIRVSKNIPLDPTDSF
jgi:hypothetical protein